MRTSRGASGQGHCKQVLRPKANEIPELVQRLGSRRRSCVDGAQARLSVIGARAVEQLIEALEGHDDRIRARVMPLLALIRDPRARGPLIAMLLDRSSRLRAVAAQCLGRFASPDAVAALERTLRGERRARVRVAAVRSLVDQYAGGQERALSIVLERLDDAGEMQDVRLAALSVLPQLRESERVGLLERLRRDSMEPVSRAASEILAAPPPRSDPSRAEIARLVADLRSPDYTVWNHAVARLGAAGAGAVGPLIEEMQSRAHDPESCTRAGMALKAVGPRHGGALAEAIEAIDEPLPLSVLVEVIGAYADKPLIYRLEGLVERLAHRSGETDGLDLMQRVRAKAHLELARIGSRVAIQDLRDALADTERRVELELLAAMRLIGKKEEIELLLRAYEREDDLVKREIADTILEIRKRERLRRNDRLFQALPAHLAALLRTILPPARSPRRRQPVLLADR
jgi:HEAT repeat protein